MERRGIRKTRQAFTTDRNTGGILRNRQVLTTDRNMEEMEGNEKLLELTDIWREWYGMTSLQNIKKYRGNCKEGTSLCI